jgi:hypothetical protein
LASSGLWPPSPKEKGKENESYDGTNQNYYVSRHHEYLTSDCVMMNCINPDDRFILLFNNILLFGLPLLWRGTEGEVLAE